MPLLLSTAPQEGEAEREVLISFPWDPLTGCVEMAQSCTRRSLDWTLGSISLLKSWSNSEMGFLERWWMPQDSMFKKILDKVNKNIL